MQMLKYCKLLFEIISESPRALYNLYYTQQGHAYLGRNPQGCIMKHQHKLTSESNAGAQNSTVTCTGYRETLCSSVNCLHSI